MVGQGDHPAPGVGRIFFEPEKLLRHGIHNDENKNAGRAHLADPIVETSQPLLSWQKPHREEKRDDNRD